MLTYHQEKLLKKLKHHIQRAARHEQWARLGRPGSLHKAKYHKQQAHNLVPRLDELGITQEQFESYTGYKMKEEK